VAVAVVGVGSVAGIVLVDRGIMPGVVGVNKGIVAVPSVVGSSLEDARQALYNLGLVCRVSEVEFNDTVPEEHVVRQLVDDGAQVKRGRHIDVVVSGGPVVGVVPPVKGLAEHIAKLELRKKGFKVGRSRKKYHERTPAGYVITAVPEEGTSISREMAVNLMISEGPRPTHATMVNVVGERIGTARTKVAEAGLKLGRISYDNNPSLEPGTVVSQSVPPGTSVPLESSVDVVVSVRK
jgi:serine/threonine-protein kinase